MIRFGRTALWLIAASIFAVFIFTILLIAASDRLMQADLRLADLRARGNVLSNAPHQFALSQLQTRLADLSRERDSATAAAEPATEGRIVSALRDDIRMVAAGEIAEEAFRTLGVAIIAEQRWLRMSIVLRLPPERIVETIAAIEGGSPMRIVDGMRATRSLIQSSPGASPVRQMQLMLTLRAALNPMSLAGGQL